MERLSRWALFVFFLCLALYPARPVGAETIDIPAEVLELNFCYSTGTLAGTGVGIQDAEAAIRVWIGAVAREVGAPVMPSTIVVKDLNSIVDKIRDGKLDVIGMTTMEYLAMREKVPLEPLFVGRIGDSPTVEYLLLVSRGKGLKDLSQLQGENLIVQSSYGASIALTWIDSILMKQGLPESGTFFGKVSKLEKASRVVLPVFFEQTAACIVTRAAFDAMVELNPQVGKRLHALETSPAFLRGLACTPKNLSEGKKEMVRAMLYNLHSTPKGRQLLMLFKVNKLIPFEPSDLESLLLQVKEHDDLKAKSGRGKGAASP